MSEGAFVTSGAGATPAAPGAGASASPRTLWVKKHGDASFIKFTSCAEDVSDLLKEVAKELPSLQDKDLSTFALHVATNKTYKDEDLKALDNTESVTGELHKAFPGHTGKWFVVVKDATAAAPLIVINELVKEDRKFVPVPRAVHSEAEFNELTRGLNHVRLKKGKKVLRIVTSWKDAVARILEHPDATLELFSLAAAFDQISNHSAAFYNNSTGAERQHCNAFAQDRGVLSTFHRLQPLNDARGVKFTEVTGSGRTTLIEVDGFVINSKYLFVLETKSNVDLKVITGFKDEEDEVRGILGRLEYLWKVVRDKGVTSNPAEIKAQCLDLKLVPVVTGKTWQPGTEELCHKQGIICLKPVGEGGTYITSMPSRVTYLEPSGEWGWHDVTSSGDADAVSSDGTASAASGSAAMTAP